MGSGTFEGDDVEIYCMLSVAVLKWGQGRRGWIVALVPQIKFDFVGYN